MKFCVLVREMTLTEALLLPGTRLVGCLVLSSERSILVG